MIATPIIAVDFDGCLCTDEWPGIGKPNLRALHELKKRQRNGARIILWTCRTGEMLQAALDWCRLFGLDFDAVNANVQEVIDAYGGDARKIFAHEYWDDKAVVCHARDV